MMKSDKTLIKGNKISQRQNCIYSVYIKSEAWLLLEINIFLEMLERIFSLSGLGLKKKKCTGNFCTYLKQITVKGIKQICIYIRHLYIQFNI